MDEVERRGLTKLDSKRKRILGMPLWRAAAA